MTNKNAYAQSGVDVEAGYEVVERIKKHVARTAKTTMTWLVLRSVWLKNLKSLTVQRW